MVADLSLLPPREWGGSSQWELPLSSQQACGQRNDENKVPRVWRRESQI